MGVYNDQMKTALPDETLKDWLARGVLGDETACAALYAHFSPAIQHLALGLLNDLADAEEVTQDTFVYAFRNLGRYDAAKSAFSTWLFTIAISRSRNKRRRKWLALFPLWASVSLGEWMKGLYPGFGGNGEK